MTRRRAVPGHPRWEADEDGHLWRDGCPVPGAIGSHGYRTVNVGAGTESVHRMVCAAFHGPPPASRPHVAHGNGNQLDNRPANLRWVSRSENMEDARRHGTLAVGERHGNATLTDRQVEAIRARYAAGGVRQADLAAEYGCSRSLISLIVNRRTRACA